MFSFNASATAIATLSKLCSMNNLDAFPFELFFAASTLFVTWINQAVARQINRISYETFIEVRATTACCKDTNDRRERTSNPLVSNSGFDVRNISDIKGPAHLHEGKQDEKYNEEESLGFSCQHLTGRFQVFVKVLNSRLCLQ